MLVRHKNSTAERSSRRLPFPGPQHVTEAHSHLLPQLHTAVGLCSPLLPSAPALPFSAHGDHHCQHPSIHEPVGTHPGTPSPCQAAGTPALLTGSISRISAFTKLRRTKEARAPPVTASQINESGRGTCVCHLFHCLRAEKRLTAPESIPG